MLLLAIAGLFALAIAGESAGPTPHAMRPAEHHLYRDSLRMLHARGKGAALPAGLDVNNVIQQARSARKPGPPRPLEDGPVGPFGKEFEVAPDADNGEIHEYPQVAFDPTDNQYLVVWGDFYAAKIYGARVKADGTLLDRAGFQICDATRGQDLPSVAFDGTKFLVVWQDDRDYNGSYDIYGALVYFPNQVPDIALLGEISKSGEDHKLPSVAFNGTSYLVVWCAWRQHTDSWSWDICGQCVNTSGDLVGSEITISDEDHNQLFPKVASDGTNFLVVWQDERGRDDDPPTGTDIYGALVTTAGGVMGLSDPISNADDWQTVPSVAFDGTDYLVVWQDERNGYDDIYGARVTNAGGVRDQGDDAIAISPLGETDFNPAVEFDGIDYLVVWENDAEDWHVHGRTLSLAKGLGDVWDFSTRLYDEYPAVACGPVEGKAMVAYQALDDDDNYRIWARVGSLTFQANPDVATVSIQRPVASFITEGSWPIPPMAQLTNNGDEPRSFDATFTITNKDDEVVYTRTKTVLGLRPTTPRSEVFPPFDLATEGSNLYTATCQTMLDGDEHSDNDKQDTFFQGCDFINFTDLNTGGLVNGGNENWKCDKPSFTGWSHPPMDDSAWCDDFGGNYSDDDNSYLTSPAYELTAGWQGHPSIAFQHSYKTTSDEDGGNFSYADNSAYDNWTVLSPTAGQPYTGDVGALLDEDNKPELGWSGNSNGWVQSVFEIPVASGKFKVRWRFASDANNEDLPGWFIDEVAGIGCELARPTEGRGSMIDTVNVAPTLVHGPAQVNYTLVKDCNVTINLYDASGRLAARVPTSGFKKGQNTAKLDASSLARGVYFVKVKGETDSQTTKVIIE